MGKSNETAQAPAAQAPAPEQVTLEEFCMRLSNVDKRVELIGGFEHSEKAAGHTKDAESEFQARFTAFVNKPV
jgi:hypothetical protein